MGNILGEGFDEPIKTQIHKRQEILGLLNKTDDVISWSNANNAWLRLASSVDFDGDSNLAKENVLFGGTLLFNQEGNKSIWGIKPGFDSLNIFDSNYGLGSFGFRPMSNLIEAKVDYLTGSSKGSLRKAEIKIKAYDIEQFEIIDKLYLRLGYHILLEWGNSIYLNNQGEIERFNTFNTVPFFNLFKKDKTFQDILDSIQLEKNKYFGNYDAFYGKIANFNWSFNEDGTYDIFIIAYSQGDIIESLKINNSLGGQKDSKASFEGKKSGEPYLEYLKDITSFNKFLYDSSYLKESDIKIKYNLNSNCFRLLKKDYKGDKSWLFGSRKTNIQYYISLGGLLEYLEKHQNIIINENSKKLYLRYDYSDKNYCLTYPGQFSSDPNVCLIPCMDLLTKELIQQDCKEFNLVDNLYVGNLMFVAINLELLASLLFNLKDERGNVNLFIFIKELLNKVNLSLGGINHLKLYYDSEINLIKIIDYIPLKYGNLKETKKSEFPQLNLYGIKENNGSFITKLGFTVSVPKEAMNTVVYGSQLNGNQPGKNATGYASLNQGLIDRTSPVKIPNNENISSENQILPEEKFKHNLVKINKGLQELYINKNLTEETIKFLETQNKDFSEYTIGYLSSKQIPSPVFFPFALNLEMMGLGGIKIYQKFNITENSLSILPSTYKNRKGELIVDFLVVNISHLIRNNSWKTTIEAQTVPVEPEATSQNILFKNRGLAGGPSLPQETPIIFEDNTILKTRLLVKRISQDLPGSYPSLPKGQSLGEISVLNEGGGIMFSVKVVELPYLNNIKKRSSIPVGEYNVAKRTTTHYGNHFILKNVPGRDGILIHKANYAEELLGCQAPGLTYITDSKGKQIGVANSGEALYRLLNYLPDKFKIKIE